MVLALGVGVGVRSRLFFLVFVWFWGGFVGWLIWSFSLGGLLFGCLSFDVLVRSRSRFLLWWTVIYGLLFFVLLLGSFVFCLSSGLVCVSALLVECFVVVSQSLVEVSSWEFAFAGVTCDYF